MAFKNLKSGKKRYCRIPRIGIMKKEMFSKLKEAFFGKEINSSEE